MSKCSIPTLTANASSLSAMLSPGQRPIVRLALLSSILQKVNPSFVPSEATINTLLSSARCFNCLSPGEMKVMKAQLLCEILNAPSATGSAPGVFTASAMAVSSSAINLSWGQPTGTGVTFNVYRGTAPGVTIYNGTLISSNNAGLTFGDTALSASTLYYYLIVANNAFGSSNATCNATTQASPAGSFTVNANIVSPSEIDLSCTTPSGTTPIKYQYFISTVGSFGPFTALSNDQQGSAFSVTGLNEGTQYWFYAQAHNVIPTPSSSPVILATTSYASPPILASIPGYGSTTLYLAGSPTDGTMVIGFNNSVGILNWNVPILQITYAGSFGRVPNVVITNPHVVFGALFTVINSTSSGFQIELVGSGSQTIGGSWGLTVVVT